MVYRLYDVRGEKEGPTGKIPEFPDSQSMSGVMYISGTETQWI